jgi:shikimate dehydrogenase
MRKFGLIGFPLGHSFSKLYFTNKFNSESLPDCSYDNYEIESLDSVKELIYNDLDIKGLNVTIPYKSEILKYLDFINEVASEIGAVNVLKISDKDDGRIITGFNTDIFGFRETIAPFLQNRKISKAVILGTGGSSKAVAFVLRQLRIEITYVSRISTENSISYKDLTDEILLDNKLVINTTPLGMFPDIDRKPDLNYDCLTADHILFDLIYNPEITTFLANGKARGCTVIGGLNMLRLQAEKSWEIWNNEAL